MSDLNLRYLRQANIARLPKFKNPKGEPAHAEPDGSDWALSAWSNAVLGELGEAASIIKKIERGDFTLDEKREELAKEFADVLTYLDILAFRAGVDLGQATIDKFNEVSKRVGAAVYLVGEEVYIDAPGIAGTIEDAVGQPYAMRALSALRAAAGGEG